MMLAAILVMLFIFLALLLFSVLVFDRVFLEFIHQVEAKSAFRIVVPMAIALIVLLIFINNISGV